MQASRGQNRPLRLCEAEVASAPADLPRGKARLKKISLWSKAQDKPRLHICRLLAPGAIGQIDTHQCGWFSSFPLSGADDRTERRCGRMTPWNGFAVGGSRARGVQRCK